MTDRERAEVILEELDNAMSINWNFKEMYLKAIEKGLREIRQAERTETGE